MKPWPSGFSAPPQSLDKWRVTYASGKVIHVMALDDLAATHQAAFYSPGDEVVAVLRVG